jgi:hypothetical protein
LRHRCSCGGRFFAEHEGPADHLSSADETSRGAEVVSYAQLNMDLLESVVAGFGVELDGTVGQIIEEHRRVYSKDPKRHP